MLFRSEYLRADPEYFFSEYCGYGFDLHQELDKFAQWLFHDPQAKDCINVVEAWKSWLDRLVDEIEASESDNTDHDETAVATSNSPTQDRITRLAEVEAGLDGWAQAHNANGVNVYDEFARFKVWLFETAEGRAEQDVFGKWESRINKAYKTAEASPQKKEINIFG